MDDVKEFANIIASAPNILVQSYTGEGCVVFCSATNKFLFSSDTEPVQYYSNWPEANSFGVETIEGRTPVAGKIYVDTSTNKQYRWGGTKMATIGSDLALGIHPIQHSPEMRGHKFRKISHH